MVEGQNDTDAEDEEGSEGGIQSCSSEVGSAGSLTWIPVPSAPSKLAGKLMHIYSDRNNNNNENW